MAQLRLGILPLKVETGRFERISLQDRLCEFCSENAIEDEEHFLFRCDLYHDLRQKFIGKIIDEIRNVEDEAAMARIWKHMFENFSC